MTPTNELRFVERKVSVPWQSKPEVTEERIVHVLQQKWAAPEGAIHTPDEWRDVPFVKEPTT